MIFKYLNTDQLKKQKQNPQTIFAASPCLRMSVYLFNLKTFFTICNPEKQKMLESTTCCGVVRLDAPSGE